jgi:hypothetical protein
MLIGVPAPVDGAGPAITAPGCRIVTHSPPLYTADFTQEC